MYVSKSRFINWTRCKMYYALELQNNPKGMPDIYEERKRVTRENALEEMRDGVGSSGDQGEDEDGDESFDARMDQNLEALFPYYEQVEEEALRVAKKYFKGKFIAAPNNPKRQKHFEYMNGHTYHCFVDIYNENEEEINIIEVKATTNSKYLLKIEKDGKEGGFVFSDAKRGGNKYAVFVKEDNIWRLNIADSTVNDDATTNFEKKKSALLDRYNNLGKYPHDLAFQKFVIDNALREAGDYRRVNYYLAVLNNEYVYDGTRNAAGKCIYDENQGQEIITFYDMNEIVKDYQPVILKEIADLEKYIAAPHKTNKMVPVGPWCAWGKNTECVFRVHCFGSKPYSLRFVPDTNSSNKYLNASQTFMKRNKIDKYWLINNDKCKFEDIDKSWLNDNQKIQRDCYNNNKEHVDPNKMKYWFGKIKYPIYHFDFETFPCPLPRFKGENPYRQSPFEFSLHIERKPGVCKKRWNNYIFLNKNFKSDERKALAKAIVKHFKFNKDGSLHGTMLAQNTSFEKGRLEELAKVFPEYKDKLLAIRDKSMDVIDLLKTKEDFYVKDFPNTAKIINYYQKDLSGSYSIKKTLPVLVPSLTYKGMEVGNGSQAYIAFINYDSPSPTKFDGKPMKTRRKRRKALKRYCRQDTWAMVEILRAVRKKIHLP